MTTDEFIVLCDGISCESKLLVKPAYEEERVRIHDRLSDDLHREIAEVYVSTGTQNFWNELAFRMQNLHQVESIISSGRQYRDLCID